MKKSNFLLNLRTQFLLLFQTEVVFLVIMALAIGIRVWQLDSKMIFFGDIGRDLLVAKEMVEEGNVPLLGIPSSVPRFRQGPVMIWYEAFWLKIGNLDPVVAGYGAALTSIVAIALLYWLVKSTVNKPVAWLATFILATSPLAIAHARMPYHITPIPLAMILYLIALYRLWEKKPYSLFLATLGWGFLFQFELATAPLMLLIPYVLWRTKHSIKTAKPTIQISAGLGLGLLPQIIFDLTHNFQHLGGFVIWVGYRIAAFGGYNDEHRFGVERLINTADLFELYFGRIVSFDQQLITLGLLIMLIIGAQHFWKQRKKLPVVIEITLVLFIIVTVAYVVHGSPSEAYFPPYLILLPILLGFMIGELPKFIRHFATLLVLIIGSMNLITAVQYNFFIGNPEVTAFTYGAGYSEQLEITKKIITESDDRPYQLRSTSPGNEFSSYLDSYRYLTSWLGQPESNLPAVLFFIDYEGGELSNYPLSTVYNFETLELILIE